MHSGSSTGNLLSKGIVENASAEERAKAKSSMDMSSRSDGIMGNSSRSDGMRKSLSEESLASMEMALTEMVVTAPNARHPERADVGRSLLQGLLDETKVNEWDCTKEDIKRLFFDSMPENCVKIDRIDEVAKPHIMERFSKRVSEAPCSVEATFHGTRANLVDSIMEKSLSPSKCSTGAYGIGAYVGAHAGTAHQYADPDESGLRHMCVVLVVVGGDAVQGQKEVLASSTGMDRLFNPTQYCFVDESRLYVSHVITYHVTNSDRIRIGGGYYDPFEVTLKGAVSRAAKTENAAGIF